MVDGPPGVEKNFVRKEDSLYRRLGLSRSQTPRRKYLLPSHPGYVLHAATGAFTRQSSEQDDWETWIQLPFERHFDRPLVDLDA
jgi:hypothetical protein